MKKKTKELVILLILGFIFPLVLNYGSFLSHEPENVIEIPKSSGTFNKILIDDEFTNNGTNFGNWTWARTQPWCTMGDGTKGNPYVIEDSTFLPAGSSDCLSIQNSRKHFRIENCTFKDIPVGSYTGIKLSNVTNGQIERNWVYNNSYGISLYKSNENNITGNFVYDNVYSGIHIQNTCNQNNIINNTVSNNKWGICLSWYSVISDQCTNNRIINNTVSNNSEYGIYSNNCPYNNYTGNTVNDNERYGFFLEFSDFNKVINNTASLNGVAGISLHHSADGNTLIDNVATENTNYGIQVYNSDSNDVINNTANRNGDTGIYMSWGFCDSNDVIGNTVNDNIQIGIFLYTGCDSNNVKDNTINRNNLGIGLKDNSNDNTISDNSLLDNGMCICEIECTGNIIDNNTCSGSFKETPIFINGTATGVGAHNWTWAESQPWCSGSGTENQPYVIANITRDGFSITNGIEIINSNVYFIVANCTFYNSGSGIKLENVNNGTLIENSCTLNEIGINLGRNCYFNNVTGNIVVNNDYSGIHLGDDCDYNNILGNLANNSTQYGIFLGDHCDNNTISQNTASYNLNAGIFLNGGGLDSSYNNSILENNVYENNHGILFEGDCFFNVIVGNIIKNNNFGIEFDSFCANNSIYGNFFVKNGKHAIDDGILNKWNSTTTGNLWDNHTSPDVSPQDGIVDTPYTFIGGSAGSIDYLPIAEDGIPSVNINSPEQDDLFGVSAPSFSVSIDDLCLDDMWYTIDGGLHNYTFTELTGTINQAAWEALSDGHSTLVFYASDIVGNVGTASITIEKDATGPIITITSPLSGAEFGLTAPAFAIIVTDYHLDSIWYSLDGGLTTFSTTTSGTIDQSTWAALTEGAIIITFYANDTLGNLSFEEVTIVKSLPSDDFDPTIVITVISISGGVVVIAGVYLFMKKRKISG